MKRRVRKIANFFAFNLLFFALYLNFIHKDKKPTTIDMDQAAIQQQSPTAFGGTVIVTHPEQYLQKKEAAVTTQQTVAPKPEEASTAALKLSIN